jgi:hypothetical protein
MAVNIESVVINAKYNGLTTMIENKLTTWSRTIPRFNNNSFTFCYQDIEFLERFFGVQNVDDVRDLFVPPVDVQYNNHSAFKMFPPIEFPFSKEKILKAGMNILDLFSLTKLYPEKIILNIDRSRLQFFFGDQERIHTIELTLEEAIFMIINNTALMDKAVVDINAPIKNRCIGNIRIILTNFIRLLKADLKGRIDEISNHFYEYFSKIYKTAPINFMTTTTLGSMVNLTSIKIDNVTHNAITFLDAPADVFSNQTEFDDYVLRINNFCIPGKNLFKDDSKFIDFLCNISKNYHTRIIKHASMPKIEGRTVLGNYIPNPFRSNIDPRNFPLGGYNPINWIIDLVNNTEITPGIIIPAIPEEQINPVDRRNEELRQEIRLLITVLESRNTELCQLYCNKRKTEGTGQTNIGNRIFKTYDSCIQNNCTTTWYEFFEFFKNYILILHTYDTGAVQIGPRPVALKNDDLLNAVQNEFNGARIAADFDAFYNILTQADYTQLIAAIRTNTAAIPTLDPFINSLTLQQLYDLYMLLNKLLVFLNVISPDVYVDLIKFTRFKDSRGIIKPKYTKFMAYRPWGGTKKYKISKKNTQEKRSKKYKISKKNTQEKRSKYTRKHFR